MTAARNAKVAGKKPSLQISDVSLHVMNRITRERGTHNQIHIHAPSMPYCAHTASVSLKIPCSPPLRMSASHSIADYWRECVIGQRQAKNGHADPPCRCSVGQQRIYTEQTEASFDHLVGAKPAKVQQRKRKRDKQKKAAGVSAAIPENCFEMKSSPAPGAASVTRHPILVDSKSVFRNAEHL
jgi:hypothetical protein